MKHETRKDREEFLERFVFPAIAHKLDLDYLTKTTSKDSIVVRLAHMALSGIRIEGLDELAAHKKATQCKYVYAVAHRSELDYVILQWQLALHGMPAIIAAGDNLLNLPYIGEFFKKCGAHAILRDKTSVRIKSNVGGRNLEQKLQITSMDRVMLANKYFEHLMINEPWDYIIFPERTADKQRKYGRSYDGSLLEFDGRIVNSLSRLDPSKVQVEVVPTFMTYERVPEDANFSRLAAMKKMPTTLKYLYDFLYLGLFVPLFQEKFRVTLKFGQPMARPELRSSKASQEYTTQLRSAVGALVCPYETQLVSSVLHQCGGRVAHNELLELIGREYACWQQRGIDMGNITSDDPATIYRKARRQFLARWRQVISEQNDKVHARRKDVIAQYHNHASHLING